MDDRLSFFTAVLDNANRRLVRDRFGASGVSRLEMSELMEYNDVQ